MVKGRDVIVARGGNDEIRSRGGNDVMSTLNFDRNPWEGFDSSIDLTGDSAVRLIPTPGGRRRARSSPDERWRSSCSRVRT